MAGPSPVEGTPIVGEGPASRKGTFIVERDLPRGSGTVTCGKGLPSWRRTLTPGDGDGLPSWRGTYILERDSSRGEIRAACSGTCILESDFRPEEGPSFLESDFRPDEGPSFLEKDLHRREGTFILECRFHPGNALRSWRGTSMVKRAFVVERDLHSRRVRSRSCPAGRQAPMQWSERSEAAPLSCSPASRAPRRTDYRRHAPLRLQSPLRASPQTAPG